MKEAIILAGGFGTRLQSVVKDVPKPMVSVSNKPFLVYLIKYLKSYGIEHIVLSVGYLSYVIEDFFKEEYLGIKISYAKEENPLGTGGAIKLALEKCKQNNIIILNGDSFFDVDIYKLEKFHLKYNALTSIAVREVENVGRYGEVILKNNEIFKFSEKSEKQEKGLINGGVYLMNKNALDNFEKNTKFSLEQNFFQKKANSKRLFGLEYNSYFIDIGIPEELERANQEFKIFKY